MKKTRYIAVALVVAVMLMGAGYAYWSDTLTIDNTVSTGEFDMGLECISDVRDYDNYLENSGEEGNPFGSGDDYVNPEIADDGVGFSYSEDKITFINTNLYPGSGACISFKLNNKGSIPAKVDKVEGTITTGSGIKDEFIYTIGKVVLYKKVANGYITTTLYDDLTPYYTFNDFIDALNMKLSIDSSNNPIILQPEDYIVVSSENGDKVNLGYDIYFDPDTVEVVSGTAITTENREFSFDIDFIYTQWNNQD